MKPPRVRWNTTEARVERFVRLAQRLELPVYGFEVRGRDVTVLTQPRGEGPGAGASGGADPVERWFRDNAGDQTAERHAAETPMNPERYSLDNAREPSVSVRWGTGE